MTALKRPAPAKDRPSPNVNCYAKCNAAAKADFDYDKHIVDTVDRSIWEALFNGDFKLAVKCDVCGRWLTANPSKKARRGPRCAAKAGGAK